MEDQGLYRVVGVTSKVNKLLTQGLDKKKAEKLNFDDVTEVETKTVRYKKCDRTVEYAFKTMPTKQLTMNIRFFR